MNLNLGIGLPLLAVIVFLVFLWKGGKYVPTVLKKDKNAFLYIIIGLVLCSFFGVRIEGLSTGSAVQQFRVNTEGAAQSGAMFRGNSGGGRRLDPLQPLSPLPPPPPGQGGDDVTGVEGFSQK